MVRLGAPGGVEQTKHLTVGGISGRNTPRRVPNPSGHSNQPNSPPAPHSPTPHPTFRANKRSFGFGGRGEEREEWGVRKKNGEKMEGDTGQ